MKPEAPSPAPLPPVGVVVVAAGSGSRLGRPKQFLPLSGRPMVHWSVDAFLKLPEVREVVVVLNPDELEARTGDWADPRVHLVAGGVTRLDSVRLGVRSLSGRAQLIAVHDGARPLVTPELARAVLAEAYLHGAAVPAVPVKDTLKLVSEDGFVKSTPARSAHWAAQTPQCYRAEVLRKALAKAARVKDASDESQLLEKAGVRVKAVASSYENLKVTTPEDVLFAETLLRRRALAAHGIELPAPLEHRTGFGYDVHRLVEGRPLVLAGVTLDHQKGLEGHSDGDVVLHAVSDALLGAASAGEIGQYFPPEDPASKDISSAIMLKKVLEVLAKRRGAIEHLDVAVLAEQPKLKPHYQRLQDSLSRLLHLSRARINIKAKTHEGLGEIGRGEAIACYAVATLTLR